VIGPTALRLIPFYVFVAALRFCFRKITDEYNLMRHRINY
jgi:hypothetical protein